MAPVINELRQSSEVDPVLCVTGQHREMLDQVLDVFELEPDFDLKIMKPGQNLTDGQLEELKSKKWDVRYADEITPKSNGPKSSGKAGVPQSD